MAKSKLTLGIELAGEEIRLAVLEKPEGESSGLTLHLARTVRSSDELARTLRALPRRPAAVTCAIPLEGAAIRILNLPPTTDDNLERVVNMESESALPLGGEELALSHHVLGMNDQSRLEVLAAAAKLTTVQEALRRVNCLPWVSAQVTVTAAALINLIEAQPAAQREEACAILRIERNSTELVVLERGRIVTTQFLSVGCGDAQGAPVQEPVAVAAGAGAQTAGGAPVPPALAWVASVTQPVRFALQALAYERGLNIQRLYLCGEGATRSGAEWQIADRLDVTPIILGPPSASTSGSGDESGLYAVAYGCALQASGAVALNLNLTPARVTVAREIEQRRQTRISWGALAGAVVLSGALIFAGAMTRRQRQLDQLNATLRELGDVSAVATMSPTELKKSKEAIDAQLLVRVPPSRLISTLSRQFPVGTWLADLGYNSGTGCTIRGYSLDQNGPQRSLIAMLRQQMFDDVTLDYQTEEVLNNVRVWGFQLTCKLRPVEAPKRSRRTPARGGQQQ